MLPYGVPQMEHVEQPFCNFSMVVYAFFQWDTEGAKEMVSVICHMWNPQDASLAWK